MTYPRRPDDGHKHEFEDAEGCDPGTDANAVICVLCGLLSVEDAFDHDAALDGLGFDHDRAIDGLNPFGD